MNPSVSIICQPDGLRAGTQIARLLAQNNLSLITNFPCDVDTVVSSKADTLVNEETALVVLLISAGWFHTRRASSGEALEAGTMNRIFSLATRGQSVRIYPIILEEELVSQIQTSWIGNLQWYLDTTQTRNQLLAIVGKLEELIDPEEAHSAFEGAASVIAAIESASAIELVSEERVPEDRVAYDVYSARHKFYQTEALYIHLFRGTTISKSATHIMANPRILECKGDIFFVLSHERRQTRLSDRIDNIKRALKTDKVRYIEDIVSQQISQVGLQAIDEASFVSDHYFLEPQLKRSLLPDNADGSEFERVVSWLESEDSGIVVIEGQGGIGKTWTMKELHRRIVRGEVSFRKKMSRKVIFISSTDINRPSSMLNDVSGNITLYDLYHASVSRAMMEAKETILSPETFYNALAIGNIIVFVDGLDEVIARHRATFQPDAFFEDIQERLGTGSNGKIFISCRTLFFDHFEYVIRYPSVQSYELLAFDAPSREKYFRDSLGALTKTIETAVEMSDTLALIPEASRYVPFVLSLIVDILLEEADGGRAIKFHDFSSEQLNPLDHSDRIIGQFCEREITKIGDPLRCMNVDQQVDLFSKIAVATEGKNGAPDGALITELVMSATGLRSVGDMVDAFLSHPFLSVVRVRGRAIVNLRFDFMKEHFLMLHLSRKLKSDTAIDVVDLSIFIKYCSERSAMCSGLVKRLNTSDDEFGLTIIDFHDAGERLITDHLTEDEGNILKPGSTSSEFSYSLITLVSEQQSQNNRVSAENFTFAIKDIFSTNDTISRMAIIDTAHSDETGTRIDFRGLTFSECLFHSVDIWSCSFDEKSYFNRCRFISCDGVRSRDSGITEKTFDANCIFDDVFEKVFSAGQVRVDETQTKVRTDITSFVYIYYSGGVFVDFTEDYLAKHYARRNPSVQFRKMFRTFRKHEVIVLNAKKKDKQWYMIAPSYQNAVERLISQGVFSGKLRDVAEDLI